MPSKSVELLIVGAGLHGLIMAKTYLEVHPSATLLVVDESQSVGGTWARERLYPGLKTNNLFGSYELSDFPMDADRYSVDGQGHIPGHVVHAYLCDVADHFGITPHLMLSTRVTGTNLLDDGSWEVSLQSVGQNDAVDDGIRAAKLVFATGLTSKPHIPNIPGSETFNRLILHSKQLREQAERLADSNTVVVVGGNKSAWDVCYTAAHTGSQVHMVIRPSGGGPSYLWPRRFSVGPFELSLAKLSTTRFFTLFDPALSGAGAFSWARRFLHRTSVGQKICQWFWTYLDKRIRKLNGFGAHPELRKLEPWTTPFWMGNSLSIHNYETNWFDLVRAGKIQVHISELETLSPGKVHLSDGTILAADALVLCTGWNADVPARFKTTRVDEIEEKEAMKAVNAKVPYFSRLSRRTPNAPGSQDSAVSPDRKDSPFPLLYRDIIPLEETHLQSKSVAFIGMSVSIHAALVAQAQALWITAFLSDQLYHLRVGSMNHERIRGRAIVDRVYGEVRRPRETGGLAGRHADLVFDSLSYVDVLLSDLAVPCMRKKNWPRELTDPYCLADYRGLVQEWIRLRM
ncbi:hypothetical protein BJY01DRAFT_248145 [Aspergillus pseudoustus]|uniref:FAD/NAD(P)-binding domain-containing protein n=1 Tax=Aspergillus pseudoustus TaxID=1810923 RepID=A0ABR4K080_9EURO